MENRFHMCFNNNRFSGLWVASKYLVYFIDFNLPQVYIATGIPSFSNGNLKSQKCSNMSDFLKLKNLLNSKGILELMFAPFTFHATDKFANTVHSSFFTNTYAKIFPDLSFDSLPSFNFSMVI